MCWNDPQATVVQAFLLSEKLNINLEVIGLFKDALPQFYSYLAFKNCLLDSGRRLFPSNIGHSPKSLSIILYYNGVE